MKRNVSNTTQVWNTSHARFAFKYQRFQWNAPAAAIYFANAALKIGIKNKSSALIVAIQITF